VLGGRSATLNRKMSASRFRRRDALSVLLAGLRDPNTHEAEHLGESGLLPITRVSEAKPDHSSCLLWAADGALQVRPVTGWLKSKDPGSPVMDLLCAALATFDEVSHAAPQASAQTQRIARICTKMTLDLKC
jgi:hypothetical protein